MEVGERIRGAQRIDLQRADEVRALVPMGLDPAAVEGLPVATEPWGETTIDAVVHRHQTRGLVVVHRGRVAYEHYGERRDPTGVNRCYSMTKSFTGTLAALAVHQGRLARTDRIGELLPELEGTGFADATVGDAADMTVSIGYDEDYDEAVDGPTSGHQRGFGDYMIALGLELPDAADAASAPRSIRQLLTTIEPGSGPHGEVFAYATPTTDVLGWVLERATERGFDDLLTTGLWSSIGAELDASLSLDTDGTPHVAAGLALTTRDHARFGSLICESGRNATDDVIPRALIDTVREGGDLAAFQRSESYAYLAGYSYRDQWWLPGGPTRPLSAWGIHGQVLWVDPDAELVVAWHCAGLRPSDQRRDLEQDAVCRALTQAAAAWP
jgi:CubicO group peptidase (beta-lactamase class C family)